jgi:CheY-like chemotaxis protein
MARILLVDDNDVIIEYLLWILADEGYTVDFTHDGTTVLALVEQFQPDLVILDWMLPGIGGAEILGQLRKLAKPPKVLIHTAWVPETLATQDLVQALGAAELLAKPVDNERLLAAVKQALGS